MKKFFALLAFTVFMVAGLSAQKTVNGTIVDNEGIPLIGANVIIKGTTTGTITDIDGSFSIPGVPNDASALVISYTGYETMEVALDGTNNTFDLVMRQNANVFEEVVITGYGTELKRETTSAISSIKSDEIENLTVTSFDRAIQGKAAGVQITSGSGAPGGSAEIRIRGIGSINANNDPLIIIDGVQIGTLGQSGQGSSNPLNSINPNDIESIEILKDAASTAIYGAQGANGIIVVTTKSGNRNAKPRFNLSYQEGFVQPDNLYEMMNSEQYVDIRHEAYENIGDSETAVALFGERDATDLPYEDWIDVLWRDRAAFRTADLSFSGGKDKVDYFSSISYNRQESQVITNLWQRVSGRFNLNASLSDKLNLSLRSTVTLTSQDGQPCDGGFFVNCPFAPSFWSMPISPALDENGDYNPYPLNGSGHNFSFNQLQNAENVTRLGRTLQTINSISLGYQVTPSLTARAQFGVDIVNNRDKNVRPISIPFFRDAWGGQVVDSDRNATNWNVNATLNYSFDMLPEAHDLSVLVGAEARREDYFFFSATGRGFADASLIYLNSAADPFGNAGFATGNRRQAAFMSAKYDFNDKYIINATLRRDGSSRFGANSRFGTFYSGSLAWRISQEDFFNVGAVDELKLRVSYGTTGNSGIGNFVALSEFGTRGQYLSSPGLSFTRLGNDLLQWETSTQLDIGLDYALFENRVYGSIDVWQKVNDNLLLDTQFPTSAGIQTSDIIDNIGRMDNQGLDFEITTVVVDQGSFRFRLGGTLSFLRNEIKELDGRDTIFDGDFPQFIVGESVSFFNLFEFAGVNPANGRNMVYDANGVPTYAPTLEDVRVLDGAIPDYFGGVTASFEYKGFTLSSFLQFQGGHHLYNNELFALASNSSDDDNQLARTVDYWREPGDITNTGQPVQGGVIEGVPQSDFGLTGSTRYYSDGTYARLKEVRLGYTFSPRTLENVGLSGASVFVQGANILTWTKFNGIDPEVVTTRDAFTGSGSFAFPLGKQFSAGLNLTF